MAARAKTEYKDIPEDVKRVDLFPFLEGEDLFNVALVSKQASKLSKDALEKSRVPVLERKKQQVDQMIFDKDRYSQRGRRFMREFPEVSRRGVAPDMDIVNDQLERIGKQIAELKAMRVQVDPYELQITPRAEWKAKQRGFYIRLAPEVKDAYLNREYDKYYEDQRVRAERLMGDEVKERIGIVEKKLKKEKEQRDDSCVASGKSGGASNIGSYRLPPPKAKGFSFFSPYEQDTSTGEFKYGGRSYREQERMGSMSGCGSGPSVSYAPLGSDEPALEPAPAVASVESAPVPEPLVPSGRFGNLFSSGTEAPRAVLSNLLYDEARAVSATDAELSRPVRRESYGYRPYVIEYKLVPRGNYIGVERTLFNPEGEQMSQTLKFRPSEYLNSRNEIIGSRDLQSIPDEERRAFFEVLALANIGQSGEIIFGPDDSLQLEELSDGDEMVGDGNFRDGKYNPDPHSYWAYRPLPEGALAPLLRGGADRRRKQKK
jgi:hypothetical protein